MGLGIVTKFVGAAINVNRESAEAVRPGDAGTASGSGSSCYKNPSASKSRDAKKPLFSQGLIRLFVNGLSRGALYNPPGGR